MKGGRTKYAILSLLRLGEMSGAEVRSHCQMRFGQFWSESYGQIYPALAAMVKEGLIARVDAKARGKAVRYRITSRGRKAHAAWVNDEPAPRSVRDELVLKMFSGAVANPAAQLDHLSEAAALAQEQLDQIRNAKTELKRFASGMQDFPYWSLVLRAGELAGRARLQWCKEAAAIICELEQNRGDAS